MFLIVGPNTGLAHSSMITMIESQVEYVLSALETMRHRSAGAVEVRADAQSRYNEALQSQLAEAIWSQGGCSSWYLDASGRNRTLYPGFTFAFRREMKRFDDHNYDLAPAPAPVLEPVA